MDTTTIAAVLVVLVVFLDKVLWMLKSRGIDLQVMSRQVDELHKWHDVSDSEGVKLWYVRRSLEEAITKLADNIALETKFLDRIDRRMESIEKKVSD